MSWLEIVIPLLCAIISSPLVIQWIQRIRIVRQLQLEGEVERWVKIGCSYAERWAANQRKENPEAKISSAEKLARARELVREHVPAPIDDAEIEARIEHELVARDERRVGVAMEYAGGELRPRVEKTR
jgi:hypothetical protein